MQRNIVIPRLSVQANIALPLILRNTDPGEAYRRAEELATMLEIEYALKRPAYTLSGGEQRRLVVARALITRPPLLLLDEPTASLDEERVKLVWKVIKGEAERGATVIVVSHEAFLMSNADSLYQMDGGVAKCIKGCNNHTGLSSTG